MLETEYIWNDVFVSSQIVGKCVPWFYFQRVAFLRIQYFVDIILNWIERMNIR